jgi:glycosyltransferase involved in cell wall biosynthesis
LIVDDGSSDRGPVIAKNLMDTPEMKELARTCQIRLLHKENGGQASARNLGVLKSVSPLIAFLDQDDEWYPTHLEELSAPFAHEHEPALGWTYSDLDHFDGSDRLVSRSCLTRVPCSHPKTNLWDCLRYDLFILPSASLISREAFEAVGGFDERLSGYEDDDLFLRMFLANYANIFVQKSLTRWRIHERSASFSRRMAVSRLTYAKKLLRCFPDEPRLGYFWGKDLIVPRFLEQMRAEFLRAARSRDIEGMSLSISHMRELLPYMSARRRAKARIALGLAKAAVAMGLPGLAKGWVRAALRRRVRGQATATA